MRAGLTLTQKERNQIQKAIAKLDQSYQQGRINPMVYRSRRGKLLADLKRPMAERTPININQESWFRGRSENHRGPSPVGYWNRNKSGLPQGPAGMQVSDNKVRASLIDISKNGYWNSQDFQNAIQTASAANQQATQNNKSYFQQAVMKSSALGSAQSTLSEAGLWESIQDSAPVVKALKRLESTINHTVQRMHTVGISKEEAKATIRSVAVSSGQSMTSQGYSKEKAAEIVAMVVRGELGVSGAISRVSSDLNNVAENIAALNHGTNASVSKPSNAAWVNNYDIHGNGRPTGVSLSSLLQAKNQLEQTFDLSNNPVERNQLSLSISQIEQTINQRQRGMNSSAMPTRKPHSSTQGPVTASYNPRDNLRAKNSTMQQTSAALNRGGPSIITVVKDLFTIDNNIYFDWTAGTPISVLSNGTFLNAGNNSDPNSVYASGEWTVFASNKNAITTLKSIKNSIGYALASPLWNDGDRAYLTYLKNETERRISYLESSNQSNAQNSANNTNSLAELNITQNALLQQNSPAVGGHNHYKLVNGNSIEIITAEANNMLPVNYHQNLHNKGYSNNQPSFNYWESNNLVTAEQAKAAQQAAHAQAERKATQQANKMAQQAAQAAQQAERKAAQQAERKAAQQANKMAQQAARAAQQAERKAAQQAERKAAQQENSVIIKRGGLWNRGGGLPGFRGSTSNTSSNGSSHGGARLVQDPRGIYRDY